MTGARVILVSLSLATPSLSICSTRPFHRAATLRLTPNFIRTGINGSPLSLRSYRGKLVLLNFWATWCGPCLTEIPTFAAWQNTYGPAGLQIVGVSMDDDSAPVKRAYEKYHLTYPVAMGDARLGKRFGGVLGLPL